MVALLTTIVLVFQSSTVPAELLLALQNRASATKGDISWTVQTATSTMHYRTRFAGADHINEREQEGGPSIQSAIELQTNGEFWVRTGVSPIVFTINSSASLPDAPAIGFSPMNTRNIGSLGNVVRDPLSWGSGNVGKKTYRVATDGRLKVVTTRIAAEGGGSPTIIKQWLDPNKGMNIIKSQLFQKGKMLSEAITLLEEYGEGHWFPSATNVYHGDDSEPVFSVTVDHAAFDDPRLPDSFGPEDIGVEIGSNINKHGFPMFSWDGEKLAPFVEVANRVNDGELRAGPTVTARITMLRTRAQVRRMADEKGGAKNRPWRLNQTLGAWERYVLQFIRFYGLDAGQHNKAISIFATVKKRAGVYLNRKQKGIESLEKRIADLGAVSDTTDKTKMLNQLADERVALEKPLLDLFNNALKPRLHSLLTRKQKALGELP